MSCGADPPPRTARSPGPDPAIRRSDDPAALGVVDFLSGESEQNAPDAPLPVIRAASNPWSIKSGHADGLEIIRVS